MLLLDCLSSANCVTALKLSVENYYDFALLSTAAIHPSYAKVKRTRISSCFK